MSIRQMSVHREHYDYTLERSAPTKVQLVKANPFTCPTCIARGSVALTCPGGCNGTGYTGMPKVQQPTDWLKSPASTTYYITADIQIGKGRYGTGGDFLTLIADLGKMTVGDAIIFTKLQEFDRRSGTMVYPDVNDEQVRPDRIIDRWGTLYTVSEMQIVNIGDDAVGRGGTLVRGYQNGKS